eukprot:180994-Hanusia_phi.AAC.8
MRPLGGRVGYPVPIDRNAICNGLKVRGYKTIIEREQGGWESMSYSQSCKAGRRHRCTLTRLLGNRGVGTLASGRQQTFAPNRFLLTLHPSFYLVTHPYLTTLKKYNQHRYYPYPSIFFCDMGCPSQQLFPKYPPPVFCCTLLPVRTASNAFFIRYRWTLSQRPFTKTTAPLPFPFQTHLLQSPGPRFSAAIEMELEGIRKGRGASAKPPPVL